MKTKMQSSRNYSSKLSRRVISFSLISLLSLPVLAGTKLEEPQPVKTEVPPQVWSPQEPVQKLPSYQEPTQGGQYGSQQGGQFMGKNVMDPSEIQPVFGDHSGHGSPRYEQPNHPNHPNYSNHANYPQPSHYSSPNENPNWYPGHGGHGPGFHPGYGPGPGPGHYPGHGGPVYGSYPYHPVHNHPFDPVFHLPPGHLGHHYWPHYGYPYPAGYYHYMDYRFGHPPYYY